MRLLPTSLLSLISVALSTAAQQTCSTHSLPNPISSLYPQNITGTLNGTIAILPIPMALARSMIPPQYNILINAYRALLPHLPEDMYPAIVQAVFDHDVGLGDWKIEDFSRASIEFPFIDLLSDNKTPFRWVPDMFLTSTNHLGINASREYGGEVYPATFEPACDAYAPTNPSSQNPVEKGSTYFRASAKDASLEALFNPLDTKTAFPSSFFRKVVNQPIFGDGSICNAQLRMFNTTLSTGAHSPRPVSATIRISMPALSNGEEMTWTNAIGIQVDTPFIEQHLVSCESFRGYEWQDDSPATSSTTAVVEDLESNFENNVAAANSSTAQQSPALTLSTILAYANAVTPAKQAVL